MTDASIIDLYWARAERAIAETDRVYGPFCYSLAYGILSNREDSEESVSDAYMAAWNSMPPARPESLKAYLAKLTRRISISRLRKNLAFKRGGGEAQAVIDELEEVLPAGADLQETLEVREIAEALNRFLAALPVRERRVLMLRCYYALPINEIAAKLGLNLSSTRTILQRNRARLRRFLEEEGLI